MKTHKVIKKRPSICFVALNSYNMFAQRDDLNHIGGAEVQQWLIARWLVKRGYRVSFLTLDHGQPDGEVVGGITIFTAYRKEDGIAVLRFLSPRWTGLNKALSRVNADIYYQRCACLETGQVALWCKINKRPFLYAVASENDCIRKLPFLTSMREKILYRIGLRLATVRLAQTRNQQSLLKKQFGFSSILFRNVCPSMSGGSVVNTEALGGGTSVLWVGRIGFPKRFEWLLDIAQMCPELHFDVVGTANSSSAYALSLIRRAAKIPNIRMHGCVPYEKMPAFYRDCRVLCCTSLYEGFPNTFLEAWRAGIPVVSTYEVDGVIASEGLGWMAHSVEEAAGKLKEVYMSEEMWQRASVAARRYYLRNHTLEENMVGFERMMLAL